MRARARAKKGARARPCLRARAHVCTRRDTVARVFVFSCACVRLRLFVPSRASAFVCARACPCSLPLARVGVCLRLREFALVCARARLFCVIIYDYLIICVFVCDYLIICVIICDSINKHCDSINSCVLQQLRRRESALVCEFVLELTA